MESDSAATVTRAPVLYRKLAPLSRSRHKDWYLEPPADFGFAATASCVYVAGGEFEQVAREYPIVFATPEDGTAMPLAVLGLRNNQNLFVHADGRWSGRYIPGYIRRYPFMLAADASGRNFTTCIDEGFPGFNQEHRGEALLDAAGGETPLLQRSLQLLRDYQAHIQRTTVFCRHLQELGLLGAMQANIELAGGEKFSLRGFLAVQRDRLKSLSDQQLRELLNRDYLHLVYAHLNSLSNLQSLVAMLG